MASSVSSSRWTTSPPQTSQIPRMAGGWRHRVVGPAVDADPAGGQAPQHHLGRDLEVDDQVEGVGGQDLVEPSRPA